MYIYIYHINKYINRESINIYHDINLPLMGKEMSSTCLLNLTFFSGLHEIQFILP